VKADDQDAPIVADIDGDGSPEILFTSGDSVFVRKHDLTAFPGNASGLFSASGGGVFQPAVIDHFTSAATAYVVLVQDSIVNFYSMTPNGTGKLERSVSAGGIISTPVYSRLVSSTGKRELAVGTKNSHIAVITDAGVSIVNPWTVVGLNAGVSIINQGDSGSAIGLLTFDGRWRASSGRQPDVGTPDLALATSYNLSNGSIAPLHSTIRLTTENRISIEGPGARSWSVPSPVTGSFALGDINGDGQSDIIVGTRDGLYAYNNTGALIENFPLRPIDGGTIKGSPIVVRNTANNSIALIFGSTMGHVYAYSADGKLLSGFPLQTGGIASSLTIAGSVLVAASTDSSIYVWNVGDMFGVSNTGWTGYLGGPDHSNMSLPQTPQAPRSNELLPKSLAYNWPNPVYDKLTHIRYYLGKAAAVTVKIFTMAGEKVATLSGSGQAHTDNEIDWDVSSVQSGIYLAQIEADANGEKSSTLIKIAVVK
ncbi:MAG TPA: T9SS type A sorting domain-containing protein, partial [Bacteroidota bacterium]|nr:T9SS type A sorting domain-containing protein [Bacteroidota bacterium]